MSLSKFKLAAAAEPSEPAVDAELPVERPKTLRNFLMGGAAALPWLGVIKRPRIHEGKGPEFDSLEAVQQAAAPGDVVVSSPEHKTWGSLGTALGTGTPDATHAQFVDDHKRLISVTAGRGAAIEPWKEGRRYALLRPRKDLLDPTELGRKYREHFELSEKLLAQAAKKGMPPAELQKIRDSFYASGMEGVLTSLREPMKPEWHSNFGTGDAAKATYDSFKKKPSLKNINECVGGWCTAPGAFALPEGMDVVPGKTPQQTTPADFLKSPLFEPAGGYGRNKNTLINKLLKAAPNAARLTYGAMGVGAVYGADKLLSKLKKKMKERKDAPTPSSSSPPEP